jgi:hypothetical protein
LEGRPAVNPSFYRDAPSAEYQAALMQKPHACWVLATAGGLGQTLSAYVTLAHAA